MAKATTRTASESALPGNPGAARKKGSSRPPCRRRKSAAERARPPAPDPVAPRGALAPTPNDRARSGGQGAAVRTDPRGGLRLAGSPEPAGGRRRAISSAPDSDPVSASLEFSEPAPGPLHGRPLQVAFPSLVTSKGNSHTGDPCSRPVLVKEDCPHGLFRYLPMACRRWVCPACRKRRVAELIPELTANLDQSRREGQTLKFLTLTWSSTDLAARSDELGRKRRARDLAHLVQGIRRKGLQMEYLKVPELHRSGAVHLHLVVRMPYIRQAELSEAWRRVARGSFRVDVRAASARCPACRAAGRPGRIVPGRRPACNSCGLRVSSAEAMKRLVRSIAWEIGKYLGKAPAGRVTRSRGWVRPPAPEPKVKKDCCAGHTIREESIRPTHLERLLPPGVKLEDAVFSLGGERCSCFDHPGAVLISVQDEPDFYTRDG